MTNKETQGLADRIGKIRKQKGFKDYIASGWGKPKKKWWQIWK